MNEEESEQGDEADKETCVVICVRGRRETCATRMRLFKSQSIDQLFIQ